MGGNPKRELGTRLDCIQLEEWDDTTIALASWYTSISPAICSYSCPISMSTPMYTPPPVCTYVYVC